MSKYLVETFGCQMNQHDSERMAGLLEQAGYERTENDRDADVIVINTCSVRERAEEKLYTRLGEIRVIGEETGARPVVAVAGCVAQQEGEKLLSKSNGHIIDVLIGTQSLKMLPMLIGEVPARSARPSTPQASAPARVDLNPYDDVSFPLGVARRDDAHRAYVTIIEGCNEFCAFCVVPYTRGKERMRPVRDIVADVAHAADTGAREVQLLGQIVNHYQAPDERCDFADLLARVSDVNGIERIRFASPHPRHVTTRMMEAMRDLPKVCRHLHLPVQSGSTRVLQLMRRRHTREEYLELLARLRETMPDLALSTDMIVGFPGETAKDFEQTLSLTAAARYHSMFSFKYSPRPNTLALKRMPDDVPDEEKTRRIVALQSLQRDMQGELFAASVGRVEAVLVDATSRRRNWELSGRTAGNTVVNFPGDPAWVGQIVPVRITGANPNSLRGETTFRLKAETTQSSDATFRLEAETTQSFVATFRLKRETAQDPGAASGVKATITQSPDAASGAKAETTQSPNAASGVKAETTQSPDVAFRLKAATTQSPDADSGVKGETAQRSDATFRVKGETAQDAGAASRTNAETSHSPGAPVRANAEPPQDPRSFRLQAE